MGMWWYSLCNGKLTWLICSWGKGQEKEEMGTLNLAYSPCRSTDDRDPVFTDAQ